MQRHRFTLVLAAAALAFSTAAAPAQSQSHSTASAPIPPAIAAAKTIFLSNAGAESNLFATSYTDPVDDGPYSGDPRRGYSELYADLAASGRFQLVSSPASADLVLQLSLNTPGGIIGYTKFAGPTTPPPMFTLVIYDRRSHYILWTLTQTVENAILQKTADRNFDNAIHRLSKQFLDLAGTSPAAPALATP